MNIQPTGNMVLLKPLDAPVLSRGGIHIPQGAMEDTSKKARVVAVGPGKFNSKTGQRTPPDVQVGDVVLVLRFHLDREQVTIAGEVYSMVAEPDLWGVVESAG